MKTSRPERIAEPAVPPSRRCGRFSSLFRNKHAGLGDLDTWGADWDSTQIADGTQVLTVTASSSTGQATGRIKFLANRRGDYDSPSRHTTDCENTLGEWREKRILGAEPGPNENGRHGPSRREREHPAW